MVSVKRVAVIGSTGSIGRQTLEVIRTFPGHFRVAALAAGKNTSLLAQQVKEFEPQFTYHTNGTHDIGLSRYLPLEDLVTLEEVDLVVMSPSGISGLKPTLQAAAAGKTIALANKESLVMAGDIIMNLARKQGCSILPVDSEHSAVWQCLQAEKAVKRIILTASGGPFLNYSPEQLKSVTPEQALKHPSWLMGPKVTIDSATLLNKGLEVIEAHHLFGIGYDDIEVLVHPPSLIHGIAEFTDGSVKAHLSYPDMRLPIQYALSYPERWANPALPRIDWTTLKNLPLEQPDITAFPCLRLAIDAGRTGGTCPAVLCGAGEACVEQFLNRAIRFTDIAEIIEQVLDSHQPETKPDIETIEQAASQGYTRALELGRKRTS